MRLTHGAIFFDEEFVFHDGEVSQKLFVVLGSQNGSALVAKTTSRNRRYTNDYGCQTSNRYPAFFLPRGCCCFQEHTWVCLSEFYEFTSSRLFQDMVFGKIRLIGELPNDKAKEVMLCAKECDDISVLQEGIIAHSLGEID